MWHYYNAHCLRGLRKFDDAIQSLLEAQRHAHLRLEHKLSRFAPMALGDEKEADQFRQIADHERRFSNSTTARILSALGAVEMQRGRLTHSRQFLAAATTLIEGTCQDFVALRIRARRAIADRRGVPADDLESASRLRSCAESYATLGDEGGELSCEIELVRGRIDYLIHKDMEALRNIDSKIYSRQTFDRAAWVQATREALDRIKLLADGHRTWETRVALLEIRFLAVLNEIELAWNMFQEVRRLPDGGDLNHRADLAVFEAMLTLRRGHPSSAIELLTKLQKSIEGDPLVNAECHLLLAEAFIEQRVNWHSAQQHLEKWQVLRGQVENRYLVCDAERVERKFRAWKRDFVISADDAVLKWKTREAQLKEWLLETARSRSIIQPTLEELSKVLGVSPSTLTRWPGGASKRPRGRARMET